MAEAWARRRGGGVGREACGRERAGGVGESEAELRAGAWGVRREAWRQRRGARRADLAFSGLGLGLGLGSGLG